MPWLPFVSLQVRAYPSPRTRQGVQSSWKPSRIPIDILIARIILLPSPRQSSSCFIKTQRGRCADLLGRASKQAKQAQLRQPHYAHLSPPVDPNPVINQQRCADRDRDRDRDRSSQSLSSSSMLSNPHGALVEAKPRHPSLSPHSGAHYTFRTLRKTAARFSLKSTRRDAPGEAEQTIGSDVP